MVAVGEASPRIAVAIQGRRGAVLDGMSHWELSSDNRIATTTAAMKKMTKYVNCSHR
jgi:hypothetical protein